MRRKRRAWIAAVALSLLLPACGGQGHLEGSLRYPPPGAPPGQAPLPEPARRGGPGGFPRGLAPDAGAPPGIYFLHEQDAGLERCVLVGERVTGGSASAAGGEPEQARARAVLDMAEEARWMSGNVVLLPSFREDYRLGRLQGRIYRCDEAQRRALFERASAQQTLTVIAP